MSQKNSSDKIQHLVEKTYGARYRLRVCGLLEVDGKVLMVKNMGVGEKGFLWALPGGELNFGESLTSCLEREVYEETGILARTGKFLFLSEFINKPFHAVELFFEMEAKTTEIKLGHDPELGAEVKSIGEVKWMSWEDISSLSDREKHGIFANSIDPDELKKKSGFLKR